MVIKNILILIFVSLCTSSVFGSWSFVAVSDTYGGLENSMTLRTAQLYAYHTNISFIMSPGDFENNALIDSQFMTRLGSYYSGYSDIPWFEALGNHNTDVPTDTDDVLNVLTPSRIQTQLPGMSNFRMGPYNTSMTYAREGTTYSFDYNNAHFIVINQYYATDTGLDGHDQGATIACVYDEWYNWLVEDLEQNTQPLIFVFGHEPAFPRGNRHCGDSLDEDSCAGNYLAWNNPARPLRDKFWELLNNYSVVAHIVGHEHAFSARVIKSLDDFPGIHCTSFGNCYCDNPNWNCYCNEESNLPEISQGDTIFPTQGVIEYNDGIARDNGAFGVVEINGSTVSFYMYIDPGTGILELNRSFSYDATSLIDSCNVSADCPDIGCKNKACSANQCVYSDVVDGTSCDNGLFCDGSDTCQLGICQSSGNPCTDLFSCTTNSCNEQIDSCSVTYNNGICNDGNVCTSDVCIGTGGDSNGCSYSYNTNSCDDGFSCTQNDVCSSGTCSGTNNNVLCLIGFPSCTSAVCNPLIYTTGSGCGNYLPSNCEVPQGEYIYVDNSLGINCLTTYDPSTRSCGGGDKKAYSSIANVLPNIAPGDTILIRSGVYNEVIHPTISGTYNAPIIFKNYNNEVVNITNVPYLDATAWGDYDGFRVGIYMWDLSYITIDGITVYNPAHGWGRFVQSNNIVIKNSKFYSAQASGDVAGLKFVNSDNNQIINNIIYDGFDDIGLINSSYNLVEGNNITRGDHVLWTIKCGDYNVVRDNYFHNDLEKVGEIYDCSDSGNDDMNHFGITHVNSTKHNLVENNVFVYTAPDDGPGPYNHIQLAGQHTIVRNNVFYNSQGIGVDLTMYVPEAEYDLHNRVYNNVFYNNTGGGVVTGSSSSSVHFVDNIIKNNIFLNNRPIPIKWSDNEFSGNQMTHKNTINFLVDNNDVFTNILPEDESIWVGSYNRISLAQAQSSYPSLYKNNINFNPLFVDEEGYNFSLQNTSPLIDSGEFLTTAVGGGSNSMVLVVSDANYFSDGFGIEGLDGDIIQLENQNESVKVVDVNYESNTLTLDRSLSWNNGDGVSLKYSGDAPDLGAFEFGEAGSDSYHDADTSRDGYVDFSELLTYLGRWRNHAVSLSQMFSAIKEWKES